MRISALRVYACLALVVGCRGHALHHTHRSHQFELTPPSADPFYSIPSDIEHYKPGSVLRHRRIDDVAAFSTMPQNIKSAHQVLYRTTDSLNHATATVSTILVPHNANYSRVLSYQFAEDSAWLDCAPSYLIRRGADSGRGLFGGLYSWVELLLVDAALQQGWVINSPDHLGYRASFLANQQSGFATLDSIRALYATRNETGIHADPDVALWGYSGGSIASDFAVEQLHAYAPDVKLIGAAIGGTVPDIPSALSSLNKAPLAGLIPNGMLGMMHQYPELNKTLTEGLKPDMAANFTKCASQCLLASVEQFFQRDVFGSFKQGQALFNTSVPRRSYAANAAGSSIPKTPLFVYKSIHDEVSPISHTDALVEKYCAGGASVTYHRDDLSMHLILLITGAPDALLWLRDRFNGVPVSPSCSRENVETSLDSSEAVEMLGSSLLGTLESFIGRPLGPGGNVRFQKRGE